MTYKAFIDNIINTRGQWSESIAHEYYEKHHIIPKCIGGSDHIENLIWLTPQEHYEAHKLLALENSDNLSLILSWNAMCHFNQAKRNLKISPEEYQEARLWITKAMAILQQGENNSFYGHHHTQETKNKLSDIFKGREFSAEECEQRRIRQTGETNSFYGHKHSSESLRKISEASKQNWKEHRKEKIEYLKSLELKWWNNGKEEVKTKERPVGYVAGRLTYGKHWYTNGIEEIKTAECPDGWHKGRSPLTKNKIKNTKQQN